MSHSDYTQCVWEDACIENIESKNRKESSDNASDKNIIKALSKFVSYTHTISSVKNDDTEKLKMLFADLKMEINLREKEKDTNPKFTLKALQCALSCVQTMKQFEIQRHDEFQNGQNENLRLKTADFVKKGDECLEELYEHMGSN